MKIAIMADLHLGYNRRGVSALYEEFFERFEYMLTEVKKHNPDLIIIAGDFFHSKNVAPLTLRKTEEVINKVNPGDIWVIFGNHDYDKDYSWINYLVDAGVIKGILKDGINEFNGVKIYALNWIISLDKIRAVKEKSDLFISHFAPKSTGIPGIPDEEILNIPADHIFLGHFHNHMEIAGKIHIPGALEATSFNEEGHHGGYYIYEDGNIQWYETPRRKMKTIEVEEGAEVIVKDDEFIRIVVRGKRTSKVPELNIKVEGNGLYIIEDLRTKEQEVVNNEEKHFTEDELIEEIFGEEGKIIKVILERVRNESEISVEEVKGMISQTLNKG